MTIREGAIDWNRLKEEPGLLLEGFFGALIEAGAYNGLNFGVYEMLRGVWLRHHGLPAGVLLESRAALMIGTCAGVVTSTCSCPLKVIAMRQLAGSNESWLEAIRNVYKEQGVAGLWKGIEGGLMITPLDTSISFFAFDALKHLAARGLLPNGTAEQRRELATGRLHARVLLLLGFIAKAISVLVIFPLRFGKDKLQSLVGGDQAGNSTIFDAWRDAIKQDGFKGLYKGLFQDLSSAPVKNAVRAMVSERLKPLSLAFFYAALGAPAAAARG